MRDALSSFFQNSPFSSGEGEQFFPFFPFCPLEEGQERSLITFLCHERLGPGKNQRPLLLGEQSPPLSHSARRVESCQPPFFCWTPSFERIELLPEFLSFFLSDRRDSFSPAELEPQCPFFRPVVGDLLPRRDTRGLSFDTSGPFPR